MIHIRPLRREAGTQKTSRTATGNRLSPRKDWQKQTQTQRFFLISQWFGVTSVRIWWRIPVCYACFQVTKKRSWVWICTLLKCSKHIYIYIFNIFSTGSSCLKKEIKLVCPESHICIECIFLIFFLYDEPKQLPNLSRNSQLHTSGWTRLTWSAMDRYKQWPESFKRGDGWWYHKNMGKWGSYPILIASMYSIFTYIYHEHIWMVWDSDRIHGTANIFTYMDGWFCFNCTWISNKKPIWPWIRDGYRYV